MSTSSQNNGKKSSNSSIVNTPASTPITSINGNAQVNAQNSPPPNNNAPKYGTLVPNRIFVGGISANTTEGELMQLFSSYGTVKAAKIIQDRAGVSKGYGFITFESEDDAKRPLRDSDNIVLKERKLNIAPAIKKQPFSRAFDASSPPAVAAGGPGAQFFFPSGAPMPYFQGGVAYYPQGGPADPAAQQPVYQPPPVYPAQTGPAQAATYPSMMFPAQTIYMPQQYPMPMPYDYNYYQPGGGGGVGGGPPMYAAGAQSGPQQQQQQQCGPGGPPHSPPRPPCYGGGIPYAAADPVFYNLPVYGHPAMDGGPFYEGVEMGPPPAVYNAEDGFGTPVMTDGSAQAPPQDVDHTLTPSPLVYDTVPSAPPLSSLPLATYATDAKQSQQETTPSIDDRQQRNSDTPVVSLLSIDQQQEKDYTSMQKGRRHKALPPPPPPPHTAPFPTANGFIPFPPHFHHHHHHHPSVGNFVPFNGHFNGPAPDAYRYGSKMANGVRKKKRTFNDHSSRSSLRTDSNSSASCVDENKNEEKSFRTTVNTPPPPPYSPMANHGQYKIITNTRNYRNNTTTTSTTSNNNNNNNSNARNAANERTRVFNNNNNNNNGFGQQQKKGQEQEKGNVVSNPPCNSQMFAGNQGFVQTLRKGRRCVRRGGPASGNEIGAGDAPLPTGEDVTKKLETLKL